MKKIQIAFLLSSTLVAGACSAEAIDTADTSSAPERGVGKADGLFGSCFDEGEPLCGGPAAEGNCWCDDACTNWGDCCDDKAEACDPPEEPEEPACGAPEEYVDVDAEDLFANPQAFVGQKIALFGSARLGFPICTQLACTIDMPCCNSCGAGLEMDTGFGTLEMSGLGCGGNNCDVMENCAYDMGDEFIAWGTFQLSFDTFLHLDVEGSCEPEPEPEPEDECDCEEGELCIPLCPVCAAGSPPEDCQCTSTCVAGPDEPPCFLTCMATCGDIGNGACEQMCAEQCGEASPTAICNSDDACGEGEVCDTSLCIASCPFCLDCNGGCVPQ